MTFVLLISEYKHFHLRSQERDYRDTFDTKRGSEVLELSRLREYEKELQYDVNRLRDELAAEKDRTQHYMNQVGQDHAPAFPALIDQCHRF